MIESNENEVIYNDDPKINLWKSKKERNLKIKINWRRFEIRIISKICTIKRLIRTLKKEKSFNKWKYEKR